MEFSFRIRNNLNILKVGMSYPCTGWITLREILQIAIVKKCKFNR